MMRQFSSRNQRSKGGFRLKHVLQICLLLAICTWLIYQVKHSHDKKRAFEERITKIPSKLAEQPPDIFNLGRKGLPFAKENDSITEIHSKVEDDEEVQEVEQEHEQERDTKQEEEAEDDEDGKRGVDDAIDEQDQDAGDDEVEEFASEEDKDARAEEDGFFDSQEHDDDSAREAREENYKRDDVSSAVTHHARMPEHEDDGLETRGLGEEQIGNVQSMDRTANPSVGDGKNHDNSSLGHSSSSSNLSTTTVENTTFPNADHPINGSVPHVMLKEGINRQELQPNTTTSTENMGEVSDSMSAKETPHDQAGFVHLTSVESHIKHDSSNEGDESEVHLVGSSLPGAPLLDVAAV